MKCKYSIDDIIKYTENSMPEEDKINFDNHIKICESCKKTFDALVLTEKFSTIGASANNNFHIDLLSKLDNKRYSQSKSLFYRLSKPIKRAIPIAACIAIAFTAFTYRHRISEFANDTYSMLVKNTDANEIVEKDNLGISEQAITAVISSCTGKQGPGIEYDDIIELPYGKVIWITGRYRDNNNWCLAKLLPTKDEKNPGMEFWVDMTNIEIMGLHGVSFNSCNLSEGSMYNHIIVNNTNNNDIQLRVIPDDESAAIADVKNGDIINIIRKDQEWSLVRKLTDNKKDFTSYTGWVNNNYFTLCKEGMSANQGFIKKSSIVYERPDETSTILECFKIKDLIAPVVIESVEGEWVKISVGYSETTMDKTNQAFEFDQPIGWVKKADLITSFEGIDLYSLANPEIDLTDFVDKVKNEILNWEDIALTAYDTNNNIMLTQTQKNSLSNSLKSVHDLEFHDGGFLFAREAVYPFYTLEFKTEQDSYKFVVAGEDRLAVNISTERFDYYGYLNRERFPIRFMRVNKEFVECIKTLLPVELNDDRDHINYLLNAPKVHVIYDLDTEDRIMNIEGTGPQVYKCVRAIKNYMGNEMKTEDIPENLQEIATFDFVFDDLSIIKVVVYDGYMIYNGKYYSANGATKNLPYELFAGYF